MDARDAMMAMLHELLKEMDTVQSQGAGYYSCKPFARRFNRLLSQAPEILGEQNHLLGTFEPLEEVDPNDPADKGNLLLEIRIEVGQLITLLKNSKQDGGDTES